MPKVTSSLTAPLRCVPSKPSRKKVRILRSQTLYTRVNYYEFNKKMLTFFKAWSYLQFEFWKLVPQIFFFIGDDSLISFLILNQGFVCHFLQQGKWVNMCVCEERCCSPFVSSTVLMGLMRSLKSQYELIESLAAFSFGLIFTLLNFWQDNHLFFK